MKKISVLVVLLLLSVSLSVVSSEGQLSQNQVSQLYVAIFGRASEGEGNTYWQTTQGDMAVAADTMLATGAAQAYFGATLNDDQAFIEFIYKNTLGKTYAEDPDGVNYWVGELASGKSKGQVISTLINAVMDPQYTGLPSQNRFINKVAVCNYTAETVDTCPNVNDLSVFTEFIHSVTDDSTTVTVAKNLINNSGGGQPLAEDKKITNLSVGDNLTTLASEICKRNTKYEYETDAEYQQRMATYAASLTGYYSTHNLSTDYDAETQTLYVSNPRWNYSHCTSEGGATILDDGCASFAVTNASTIPRIVTGTYHVDGYYFEGYHGYGAHWVDGYDSETTDYAVIQISPAEAEKIADGFIIEYVYEFSAEDIKNAQFGCASAYFTNCSYYLDGAFSEYRVYNTITGLYY